MDTPAMALTRTDKPTVELLNKVADKMIYDHILAIAEDLRIDVASLSQIRARTNSDAKAQMYNVIITFGYYFILTYFKMNGLQTIFTS